MTRTEIPYRTLWRTPTAAPGSHRGPLGGGIGTFHDTVPYWRQPEPRRIDLRQTLRDPWRQLHVRRYEQRSSINVVVIVDLSVSMAFAGRTRKLELAAAIAGGVALFARRVGDRFSLLGCDGAVREDFCIRPSRRQSVPVEVDRLFAALRSCGQSARGLVDAGRHLPRRRALVLLLSDFRIPLAQLEAALRALARHDVVPIALEDSRETADLPVWGLIEFVDMESGQRRLALMRPSLRTAWLEQDRQRQHALQALFARHGARPAVVRDRLAPDRLSDHLLAS